MHRSACLWLALALGVGAGSPPARGQDWLADVGRDLETMRRSRQLADAARARRQAAPAAQVECPGRVSLEQYFQELEQLGMTTAKVRQVEPRICVRFFGPSWKSGSDEASYVPLSDNLWISPEARNPAFVEDPSAPPFLSPISVTLMGTLTHELVHANWDHFAKDPATHASYGDRVHYDFDRTLRRHLDEDRRARYVNPGSPIHGIAELDDLVSESSKVDEIIGEEFSDGFEAMYRSLEMMIQTPAHWTRPDLLQTTTGLTIPTPAYLPTANGFHWQDFSAAFRGEGVYKTLLGGMVPNRAGAESSTPTGLLATTVQWERWDLEDADRDGTPDGPSGEGRPLRRKAFQAILDLNAPLWGDEMMRRVNDPRNHGPRVDFLRHQAAYQRGWVTTPPQQGVLRDLEVLVGGVLGQRE